MPLTQSELQAVYCMERIDYLLDVVRRINEELEAANTAIVEGGGELSMFDVHETRRRWLREIGEED